MARTTLEGVDLALCRLIKQLRRLLGVGSTTRWGKVPNLPSAENSATFQHLHSTGGGYRPPPMTVEQPPFFFNLKLISSKFSEYNLVWVICSLSFAKELMGHVGRAWLMPCSELEEQCSHPKKFPNERKKGEGWTENMDMLGYIETSPEEAILGIIMGVFLPKKTVKQT